jgi:hypothetical protein
MPYTHDVDLAGQLENRQFSIITTMNLIAGGIGGALGWQLSVVLGWGDDLPWTVPGLLKYGLIVVCAIVGVALTIRRNGLSLLDRLQLSLGYRLRVMLGQTRIEPHAVSLSAADQAQPVLYRQGVLVSAPYVPDEERS